jgi:hypothetical protein
MGAFLRAPARKNRAFRSNSSELLRNSSGISAAIPCAEEGLHPKLVHSMHNGAPESKYRSPVKTPAILILTTSYPLCG